MNPRLFALGLVAATCCCAQGLLPVRPAHAQDEGVVREARKRFEEGVRLFAQGQYGRARAAFLQAYALKRHPDVLLNLAESERFGRRYLDAAQHFREFLADPATAGHPKRASAERGLADVRGHIGRATLRVDVDGALVIVDGAERGTSPILEPLDIAPGAHVFEAQRAGRKATQTVSIAPGQLATVDLRLAFDEPAATEPEPAAAPPVVAQPIESSVDDVPSANEAPAQGRGGFVAWALHSPVGYVGAGLLLGGLGVGTTFVVVGHDNAASADDLSARIRARAQLDASASSAHAGGPCAAPALYEPACSRLRELLDGSAHQRTIAIVGFTAAGIGAITLAGGYVLSSRAEKARSAPIAVAPLVAPGFAGISARGTF